MKQTNNAIKFLMAQYRAIFKSAYIKGLATAVVLTSALAAGQAQADAFAIDSTVGEGIDTITITGESGDSGDSGKWGNLSITTDSTSGSTVDNSKYNLVINSGSAGNSSGNFITANASGATAAFDSSVSFKDLTIANGAGLLLSATAANGSGASNLSANFANVTVNGDLKINLTKGDSGDGSVTLNTDSLTIAGTDSGNATLSIDSGSTTSGSSGAVISLGSDGNAIGSILIGEKGTVSLLKSESGSGIEGKIFTNNLTVENSGTLETEGTVITLSDDGTATFKSGSTFNIKDSATLVGGVTEIQAGVTLKSNASTDSGALVVGESGGTATTLKIGTTELKSFLSSDGGKGAVVLASGSNSILELSDTEQVDLATVGIKWANSAASGSVVAESGSFVKGDKLAVSANMSGTSVQILANDLALGSTATSGGNLGFANATTKNLNFLSNGSFELANEVNLLSTKSITGPDGKPVDVADNGTVTGDFTLKSGTLTVQGGNYNIASKVTMNGGTLSVTPENGIDANLSLTNLTVVGTSGSTITVNGTNGKAVLDLSKTEMPTISGTTSNEMAVNIQGANGTLKTNEANLNNLLGTDVAKIFVAGGTLNVVDDIELSGTSLTSGSSGSATKITFDTTSGGTLAVDGSLTLAGTKVDLANGINVKADTLTLSDSGDTVTLNNGKYTVQSGLGADGAVKTVTLASGAALNLGEVLSLDGVNSATSTGGSIDVATLTIGAGTSGTGTLAVNTGDWTAKEISVADSGTVTVGLEDIFDKDGNLITASLSGNKLTVAAGATAFKVTHGNSATFKEIAASGAKNITVEGTMTVAGVDTTANEAITAGSNGYMGFALDSGSQIKVDGIDAKFVIGSTAAAGMLSEYDATKDGTEYYVYDNFGKYNLTSGGTLVLDFQSGSFTLNQLQQMAFELTNDNAANGLLSVGKATIEGITGGEDAIVKQDEAGDYYASWTDYQKYQYALGGLTDETLMQTRIEGVNDKFVGNVGSVILEGSNANAMLNVNGNTSLNNAYHGSFVANSNGDTAGAKVTAGTLTLRGDGAIGKVSLAENTTLALAGGKADVESILGKGSVVLGSNSATVVSGNAEAYNFNTAAGSVLDIRGDLNVTGTVKPSTFGGDLMVGGTAAFTKAASFAGNNTFNKVTFSDNAVFGKGVTQADTMLLGGALEIADNAQVSASVIDTEVANGSLDIRVGSENGSSNTGLKSSSAGYLTVGRLDLNGGSLVVDPDYTQSAAVVAVNTLGETKDIQASAGNNAGLLDGKIAALRNSIVAVGVTANDTAINDLKSTFAQYLEADGSLQQDGVGSVVYVADALNVAQNSQIIVDSTKTFTSYDDAMADDTADIASHNVYIGKNSVLAVSDTAALDATHTTQIEVGDSEAAGKALVTATVQRAAIHFDDTSASVFAEKGAKVVLVGDGFNTRSNISLFSDNGTAGETSGVWIRGNDLTVETLNGLLTFTYKVDTETTDKQLGLNYKKIDSAFNQASAPVKNTLISYAANDNNWEDIDSQNYKAEVLHGDSADKTIAYDDANGFTAKKDGSKVENPNDYIAVAYTDAEGNTAYHVYEKSYNYFLDEVVRNSNTGIEAETAARLGVFGGSVQAAMTAGSATTDAIAGRFGMGAQAAGMTYADNGQGTGLWVTPIYRNADSDGFAAQGVSYGTDLNLYGVALGGDYTLANGLRVGAMFNIGSGDADGQGAGSLATNDFDYYGFAAFAGYTMGQFTVVGDISYTVVDNEVTANTAVDKIGANFDTSNLSVGVTGQYALNFNGTQVTPHAGLRFSSIDMDDYTVDGKDVIAKYNGDTMNVFSIPVGVTIAREYEGETWTLKPSFDLTLTGQFGDDEAEGTVEWAGINNLNTNVTSEVFDSFTYGATVGVAAKSGNFSLGFGLNYTGSSSVDEFGVNANARFVF